MSCHYREYQHVFPVVTVHGLNDTVGLPTPSGAPGPRVILRLVANDSSRTSSPVENVSRSGNATLIFSAVSATKIMVISNGDILKCIVKKLICTVQGVKGTYTRSVARVHVQTRGRPSVTGTLTHQCTDADVILIGFM